MKHLHLRIPAYEKREIPDGSLDLAMKRTEFLQALLMREPLSYVLACAYLQGVEDAAMTIDGQCERLRLCLRSVNDPTGEA